MGCFERSSVSIISASVMAVQQPSETNLHSVTAGYVSTHNAMMHNGQIVTILRLLPSAQGWTFGSWGCKPIAGNCVRFLSSRKCMRRWLGPGGHLFLPETGLVPPPSSPPLTVGRPKGMWRSPQSSALLPCSFARKAATPGRVIHTFRSGPVSSRPL